METTQFTNMFYQELQAEYPHIVINKDSGTFQLDEYAGHFETLTNKSNGISKTFMYFDNVISVENGTIITPTIIFNEKTGLFDFSELNEYLSQDLFNETPIYGCGGSVDNSSAYETTKEKVKGLTQQERIDLLIEKVKKHNWSSAEISPNDGIVKIHSDMYDLEPIRVASIFNKYQVKAYAKGGNTPQSMQEKHAKLICEKVPENYKKEFRIIKEETNNFTENTDVWQETYDRLYSLLQKNHTDAFVGYKEVVKETPKPTETTDLSQELTDLETLYSIADKNDKKALKQDVEDLKLLIELN